MNQRLSGNLLKLVLRAGHPALGGAEQAGGGDALGGTGNSHSALENLAIRGQHRAETNIRQKK